MTLRVRTRLALTFGVLFLLGGLALVTVNYVVVEDQLADRSNSFRAGNLPDELTEQLPVVSAGRQEAPTRPVQFVRLADGRTLGEALEDLDEDLRRETLNDILITSIVATVTIAAVAAATGWYLARRALRPIAEVTATARSIGEHDLTRRVGLVGPADEVTELADTIDEMIERLEAAYEQQLAFSAHASHELRTPLSAIVVEADNALGAPDTSDEHRLMARRVRDAADRSEHLITQLLSLTRGRSGIGVPTAVDFAEIVGDITASNANLATEHGVNLDLDLGVATVSGNAGLLEALVANLVANAILHNRPGGAAYVAVDTNGEVRLVVENDGPILDQADVERILRPFERASRADGHGLGLSVVAAVAEAHGGSIDVEARSVGGLIVRVGFPTGRDRG